VLYDWLKRSWGKDADGLPSAARTFACSTAAGFAATLATQPFDVLRTRAQLDRSSSRSVTHIRALMVEGVSVALAGFWPRLMKRTLASSVTWTVFEHVIAQLQHEQRSLST
jgi:solute carrier family 25 protein 38